MVFERLLRYLTQNCGIKNPFQLKIRPNTVLNLLSSKTIEQSFVSLLHLLHLFSSDVTDFYFFNY